MTTESPEFRPYHGGLPAFLDEMDEFGDNFLIELNVIAVLAQGITVPKEHRASVAAAFVAQAQKLRDTTHWPEDDAAAVVLECEGVATAMRRQDELDAAKEQQAQQQQ